MPAEDLDQCLLLSRRFAASYLLFSPLPSIVATNRYAKPLAQQAHRVLTALRFDKAVAIHWSSVCESLRLEQATGNSFFKNIELLGLPPSQGT